VRIALTGASGFLGSAVQEQARRRGWQILPIVRRPAPGAILWDAKTAFADPSQLEGLDAVIHLAGESIFGVWTAAKKQRILRSRVDSTHLLASSLAACRRPPPTLISVSAVGYYGDSGPDWVEPSHAPGTTFLASVCQQWEQAARPAREAGLRVTHPRLGTILDPHGGALAAMLPLYRFGLGAVMGSGHQWISWIGLQDAAEALLWAAQSPQATGAWNLVSPEPVTQKTFADSLAGALHRPRWLRLPAAVLQCMAPGLADNLLLPSCKACPYAPLETAIPWNAKKLIKIFSMV
jgi:uncharacterized protein (TIGR01777 family)